jgi:hypothetical protein
MLRSSKNNEAYRETRVAFIEHNPPLVKNFVRETSLWSSLVIPGSLLALLLHLSA